MAQPRGSRGATADPHRYGIHRDVNKRQCSRGAEAAREPKGERLRPRGSRAETPTPSISISIHTAGRATPTLRLPWVTAAGAVADVDRQGYSLPIGVWSAGGAVSPCHINERCP